MIIMKMPKAAFGACRECFTRRLKALLVWRLRYLARAWPSEYGAPVNYPGYSRSAAIGIGLRCASGLRLRHAGDGIPLRGKFLLGAVGKREVTHAVDTVFWVSTQVLLDI